MFLFFGIILVFEAQFVLNLFLLQEYNNNNNNKKRVLDVKYACETKYICFDFQSSHFKIEVNFTSRRPLNGAIQRIQNKLFWNYYCFIGRCIGECKKKSGIKDI